MHLGAIQRRHVVSQVKLFHSGAAERRRADKELGGPFPLKASILKNFMTESVSGNKAWIQLIIQRYMLQSSDVWVQEKLFKTPGQFDRLVSHNSSPLLTRSPLIRPRY